MGIELRMPSITAVTDRDEREQIRSYLYQLIPQLQWALNTLDTMTSKTGIVSVVDAKEVDDSVISNGVVIRIKSSVGGITEIQFAVPLDGNEKPMYRIYFNSNRSDWRSM